MRWLGLSMLVACGPAPAALFDVECADEDCETVLLTSLVEDGVDIEWVLDGVASGSDKSVEYTVPADELHIVSLEVSTSTSSSQHGKALIPNVVMELDGEDVPVAGLSGYDVVEEKDPFLIATACGQKEFLFSSIGGCFTGGVNVGMFYANGPTAPATLGGYLSPALFTAGGPSVTDGAWTATRARVGGGTTVADPPSATWPSPIPFQALQGTFPIGADPVWLTIAPAGSVHRFTASVQCVDGKVIYGKNGKSSEEIGDWLRR